MPIKEIQSFTVSHLQILDEDGNVDRELEPSLSSEQLVAMYRAMVLGRHADDRMLKLQRQGRIGTFAPCTGQEAASVGVAFAMSDSDWFFGAFRELAGRLARGEKFWQYLVYHNGFEEGNHYLDAGRTNPFSVIVGAQTLHAVGAAYAARYRGETDTAAVAFFGDGATSQGDVHEAMNFAAVWRAPVVFLCQNNQWAISIPREQQTFSKTLAQKAIAYDIPTLQIDGNDLLAVYYAVKEALQRAKDGGGPSFIEAVTYRLLMHTTADDPRKYRKDDDVDKWWRRCPILRFRRYLEKRGVWDEARELALLDEVKAEIDQQVAEFESKTDFQPDAPFEHVYGTKHEIIEEQRAEFLRELELDRTAEQQ